MIIALNVFILGQNQLKHLRTKFLIAGKFHLLFYSIDNLH